MNFKRIPLIAGLMALAAVATADYTVQVIAQNLPAPTGIAVRGQGPNTTIYWTEVPNPGVPMMNNAVRKMNLHTGVQTLLHMGEPDPQNIALDKFGNVFWTCRSAGVILRQSADGMTTGPILENLLRPTGISVDLHGNVYFTQVPTPGVPGNMGGMNTTNVFDGKTIHTLTFGEPEPTDIVFADDAKFAARACTLTMKYSGSGSTVKIAGEFSGWESGAVTMTKNDSAFEATLLRAPCGRARSLSTKKVTELASAKITAVINIVTGTNSASAWPLPLAKIT